MAFNPVQYVQAAYKNSPWVVISVAFHVVLVAVVSVIAVKTLTDGDKDKAITIGQRNSAPPPPEVFQQPEVIDRKSIPKNEEAEIVSFEEETYVPTEVKEEDLHLKRGDPTAADNLPPGATGGTSIGVGAQGHYGTGKPSPYATRRVGGGPKGRGGGKMQGTEAAVLEGLRWLLRHQNPDGSWAADTLRQRCSVNAQCLPADAAYNSNFNEGLTGLALLCFLGAGYDNNSKQSIVDDAMGKRYSVGEVVKNGLKWLKERQNPDGSFTHPRAFMYNEALAAMAMTEAYGMSQSRIWKEPAQKAINFLVAAQKLNPFSSGGAAAGADASAAGGNSAAAMWGWRYASRDDIVARRDRGEIDQKTFDTEMRDADTSVTTWVIMALKSAELSGLNVPREAMSGGLAFVEYSTIKNGMVGYMSPEDAGSPLGGPGDNFLYHTGVRSALGMLVRTFVKHDRNDPMLDLGAKLLLKDLPVVSKDKLSVDYYYWYYGSLALNQFDGPDSPGHTGKFWDPWNEAMKDTVLQLQDKTQERDVCSRGGWLIPDRWFHYGGPIYSTGINILTLEVYYRYGNAFTGQEKDTPKGAAVPKKESKPEPKPAAAPTDPAEPPKGDGKSGG